MPGGSGAKSLQARQQRRRRGQGYRRCGGVPKTGWHRRGAGGWGRADDGDGVGGGMEEADKGRILFSFALSSTLFSKDNSWRRADTQDTPPGSRANGTTWLRLRMWVW